MLCGLGALCVEARQPRVAALRVDLVEHPRERNAFADVLRPGDPGHRPLDPESEPRVGNGPVLPQVEVPLERFPRQVVLLQAVLEELVVVDALRAADDLDRKSTRLNSSHRL